MSVYVGSETAVRGGQVIAHEVCHCEDCTRDEFDCPVCGFGYGPHCPHQAPELLLNLTVVTPRGDTARLYHARQTSVRIEKG